MLGEQYKGQVLVSANASLFSFYQSEKYWAHQLLVELWIFLETVRLDGQWG
jgi:hypothetical protein